MTGQAQLLATKRRKAGVKLSTEITKELSELGMKKATFQVSFSAREEKEWNLYGSEEIQFLFSPNNGEPLRPLAKIASGGELSRILLAVKTILSDRALPSTSVFDEVDAGIGGAIAEVIGKKLREVAKLRQVICITHLPQVAAWGQHHFRIAKRALSGRTVTNMQILENHERLEEIARMLAGVEVTEIARRHAEELLKGPL